MFLSYNQEHHKTISTGTGKEIHSFMTSEESNLDVETVSSFGEEWTKFDRFSDEEIKVAGDQYFDIVPEGGFKLLERAPGVSVDQIRKATKGKLIAESEIPEMRI